MSRAENQLRNFDTLWGAISPRVGSDCNLPARIQRLLAGERRFGSSDRRLYRELIYTALRYFPWIQGESARSSAIPHLALWLAPDTPATLPLKRAVHGAHPPCPPSVAGRAAILGRQPAALLPSWFRAHCPAAFEPPNIDVLHTRAPLWLRLQTGEPAPVFDEFAARGWSWRRPEKNGTGCQPPPAGAIELVAPGDPDLTQTDAYRRGLVEIQDLGSQLILPTALSALGAPAFQPSGFFLDACAGAGGKTLQLAGLLGPGAQIDATDPRPGALAELAARAARAGIKNIRILPSSPAPALAPAGPKSAIRNPKSQYDAVVVDAPCSGSGTWRRNPHLKYTTREAGIAGAAQLQLEILARHAPLVRSGGLLIYATCSISRVENEEVAAAFLAAPAGGDFALARQATILPATHNTDGYFVAAFRRA